MDATFYLAVDAGHWGRGESIEGADKELRRAGGSTRTRLVYRIDQPVGCEKPHVDAVGNTVYDGRGTRTLVAASRDGKPVDPATVE